MDGRIHEAHDAQARDYRCRSSSAGRGSAALQVRDHRRGRSVRTNTPCRPDPSLALGPDATPLACAGVGLEAVLVGSASDPRYVWLSDALTGRRLEPVWPSGFTARFDHGTAFDVRNAAGRVAIVGGSHVNGACVGADAYWLDTEVQ